MNRTVICFVALALFATSIAAQSRIQLRQVVRDLPVTLEENTSDSYFFVSTEGHELHVQARKDSSVYVIVARPSRSGVNESDRRVFARRIVTNVFGSDTAITNFLDRSENNLTSGKGNRRYVEVGGWMINLMYQDGKISRLLVNRAHSANIN